MKSNLISYSLLFLSNSRTLSYSSSKLIQIRTLSNFNLKKSNLFLNSTFKSNSALNNRYLSNLSTPDLSTNPPKDDHVQTSSKSYESLSLQKSRNILAERSYFDTHLFVNNLLNNGFSKEQAEQLCLLFKEIVNFVSQDIKKDCVTKSGQELAIQQVMIHIGSLKKDMIILEKSEFSALRNENEKLVMELKNLREQLNDEIIKLRGGFTLDINLEKSRSTELLYDASNRLHRLDSRIDTEISNVKAMLETFKADTIRYIAGSLLTVLVIILGALRYFTL